MLSPVNTMPRDPAYMRWLQEMDVPMVFAGSRYVEVDAPFVTLDIYGGMLDLTRRLAAQGNRKFVLLSGAEGVDTMDQRVAGFRAGLAEAGLAGQVWYTGDTGYESAYRRVLEAPREELPPGIYVHQRPDGSGGHERPGPARQNQGAGGCGRGRI